MSGRKETTVTISQREYRQLREQAWRLHEIGRVLPEVEVAIRNVQRAVSRDMERLQERQRAFQESLQKVHQSIRELEISTAERLREQQRQMQEALQDVHREVRGLLAEQEQRLVRQIDEARQHLQAQINDLASRERQRVDHGQDWIQAARMLRDFIAGHYRHQQFKAGALERLDRDLCQAEQNLARGLAEAAVAQAQRAYHELSDLRLELEHLEAEWQLWRGAALRATEELLALAHNYRTCKAMDLEGREIDVTVEVDWWTEGKLSQLIEEIRRVQNRIQNEDAPMSIEALRQIAEQTGPELLRQLREIVWEARENVLGSQLRINIADLAVQVFEGQGFFLQDATYEGEDFRGGYVTKLTHLDGGEVVVVVSPQEGRPLENRLEIHSYDAEQRSEKELRARARELAQALHARGLQTQEPEQVMGASPDPTLRDTQHVRVRRVERRLSREP